MINFHNIVLPDFIAPYIVGGPNFDTAIMQSISGRETRYVNLNTAFQKYTIKNCKLDLHELEEFNCFFRNCKGSAMGFLLKDYTDYKAKTQALKPTSQNQTIFPLFKHYHFSNKIYSRRILKPIENSVKVMLDQNDIEIDYDCGLIKLQEPADQILYVDFDFYVPVRFEADNFNYSPSKDGSIVLDNIGLKEIFS
jgi:hypothetical protein